MSIKKYYARLIKLIKNYNNKEHNYLEDKVPMSIILKKKLSLWHYKIIP